MTRTTRALTVAAGLGIAVLAGCTDPTVAPKSTVTGKITEVTPKGISVGLEDGVTGFVASSDLSLHGGKEAATLVKEGDSVTALVKKWDERAKRVVLSVKAYEKSMEKQAVSEFHATQGSATVTLKDAMK